jgi:hypothetical protein
MYPLEQVKAMRRDVQVAVLEAQAEQVWVETWKKNPEAQTLIEVNVHDEYPASLVRASLVPVPSQG